MAPRPKHIIEQTGLLAASSHYQTMHKYAVVVREKITSPLEAIINKHHSLSARNHRDDRSQQDDYHPQDANEPCSHSYFPESDGNLFPPVVSPTTLAP
jgi:hypothetical protein